MAFPTASGTKVPASTQHERAVAASCDLVELLGERAELGAWDGTVTLIDQPGVQPELAQECDRAQDGEAVAIEVTEQSEDLSARAGGGCRRACGGGVELDLEGLLLFGREVAGDVFLAA